MSYVSNVAILFRIKLTLYKTKGANCEQLLEAVDNLSSQTQNGGSDLSSSDRVSDASRARSKVLGLLDQIAISLTGPDEFIQDLSHGVRSMMSLSPLFPMPRLTPHLQLVPAPCVPTVASPVPCTRIHTSYGNRPVKGHSRLGRCVRSKLKSHRKGSSCGGVPHRTAAGSHRAHCPFSPICERYDICRYHHISCQHCCARSLLHDGGDGAVSAEAHLP